MYSGHPVANQGAGILHLSNLSPPQKYSEMLPFDDASLPASGGFAVTLQGVNGLRGIREGIGRLNLAA